MFFTRRKALPTEIAVDGRTLPVTVTRSATARRMILRLDATTGGVRMTLPKRGSEDAAAAFLESHNGWIAARLAKLPAPQGLECGTTFLLRGEPVTIGHGTGARTVSLQGKVLEVGGPVDLVPSRVRRWLIAEARADFASAITRLQPGVARTPTGFTVRDTKSRWGSCSAKGGLNFSWRLIMAPPHVLDYVVAHELAHLEVFHHGPKFEAVVARLTPHARAARAWLKRHGPELHAIQ